MDQNRHKNRRDDRPFDTARTVSTRTVVAFAVISCTLLVALPRPAHPGKEPVLSAPQVIVLHGLGRSSTTMWLLSHRLTKSGFDVRNIDYPSTKLSIPDLVRGLATEVDACCGQSEQPLHFVTHSLGGILVRAYLAEHRPENLGRVVMLSPPNRGTELVDRVVSHPLFRWATGPTVQDLGTATTSLPNRLGPADFELGVITGSRSLNPIASWLISGTDDGVVSVSSARLKGMADFLVVPKTHTFIMNSSDVAREVIHFLNHGAFSSTTVSRGPTRLYRTPAKPPEPVIQETQDASIKREPT